MSDEETPYVVPTDKSASAGPLSKLMTWAGENKVTAVIIAIGIIIVILWWLTDKGYIDDLPISLPFKLGRKNPRGTEEDSEEDEEEGELEEDIDDILSAQTEIWNDKVKNDGI